MFLRLFYNRRTSDFIASASLLIWLAVNIFWINICFWATKLEIGDSSWSHNPCNRARFGNRTRIKSSSRPTELINICSRATELDIDFSGRGRGEEEVQIMLDIRLSRGRDNIKNYGEKKNFRKFGFSCFKASEDMISSRVPSMGGEKE